MSSQTFNDILEEIKTYGEQERKTLEVAEELARIIGSITNTRIEKGLTQRQLAEQCGIKQSAIARMESLQVIPRLDTVIKIANSLGIQIDVNTVKSEVRISNMVVDFNMLRSNPNQYNWNQSTGCNYSRGGLYGTLG